MKLSALIMSLVFVGFAAQAQHEEAPPAEATAAPTEKQDATKPAKEIKKKDMKKKDEKKGKKHK